MNHIYESLNHTKWECKYHVAPAALFNRRLHPDMGILCIEWMRRNRAVGLGCFAKTSSLQKEIGKG